MVLLSISVGRRENQVTAMAGHFYDLFGQFFIDFEAIHFTLEKEKNVW